MTYDEPGHKSSCRLEIPGVNVQLPSPMNINGFLPAERSVIRRWAVERALGRLDLSYYRLLSVPHEMPLEGLSKLLSRSRIAERTKQVQNLEHFRPLLEDFTVYYKKEPSR